MTVSLLYAWNQFFHTVTQLVLVCSGIAGGDSPGWPAGGRKEPREGKEEGKNQGKGEEEKKGRGRGKRKGKLKEVEKNKGKGRIGGGISGYK